MERVVLRLSVRSPSVILNKPEKVPGVFSEGSLATGRTSSRNLRRVEQRLIHPRVGGVAIEVAGQSMEADKAQVDLHPVSWTVIRQCQ